MKKRNRILRNRILVVSFVTITIMSALTAQAGLLGLRRTDNAASTERTTDGSFNALFASVTGTTRVDNEQPILIGSAMAPANSPVGGIRMNIRRTYMVQVSAYNSEVAQTDSTPWIGACGRVHDGIVAANVIDSSGYNLPCGTLIRIPSLFGDKIFTVWDRMNARYTRNVDVWMASRADAVKFGRRLAQVEVIR